MEYNEEATREYAKKPKVIALKNWLIENGCIFDKMQWPAIFGKGLVGCLALEEIGPMEAFTFVPSTCWISLEHAKQSELAPLYTSHDSLFVSNYDRDQLIIVIFLMYEKIKGKDSHWFPYIDYLDQEIPPCYWDKAIVDKSDNQHFMSQLKTGREKYDEEWEKIVNLLPVYPQFFPEVDKYTKELYMWASYSI